MKKNGLYVLLLLILMAIGGCDKTDDGSYVKPITISEKLSGTWTLTKLTQTDEIALANGEENTAMELTGQFDFTSFSLTLVTDADKKPTTFTVTGTAPEILSKGGYWDLDYDYPHTDGTVSKINLFTDASRSVKSATLDILTIPGAAPQALQFKLTRKVNGVPFISYTYLLSTQNQTK